MDGTMTIDGAGRLSFNRTTLLPGQCLQALEHYGKPDAFSFSCKAYEFGLKTGSSDTVYIVERWNRWRDLDALLNAKVIPALPMYNQLLKTPFNPTTDTLRIDLSLD